MPQRYLRTVRPAIPGVQQDAGIAHRVQAQGYEALSRIGAGVERQGSEMIARADTLAASRAWREYDRWKIQYLTELPTRRGELLGTSIDEQGNGQTGYDAELKKFPELAKAKFQELSKPLSRRARDALQFRYDEAIPQWSAQITSALTEMESEDLAAEIVSLGGEDRASEARKLLSTYADRFSPKDRALIERGIEQASTQARLESAQAYLQGVAKTHGWPEAGKILDTPEFQESWGLNLDEAGTIKTQLDKFVHDRSAMDAKATEQARLDLEAKLTADVLQGRLDPYAIQLEAEGPTTTLYQLIEDRRISADTGSALAKAATAKEPQENDPAAYAEMSETLDAMDRGTLTQGQAKNALLSLRGKLKPTTWEGGWDRASNAYTPQARAINEASQFARTQLVTVSEQDLQSLLMMETSEETQQRARDERAEGFRLVDYHDQQLRAFLRENPKATPEEIFIESRRTLATLRRQTVQESRSLLEAWENRITAPPPPQPQPAAKPRKFPGPPRGVEDLLPPLSPPAPAGLESVWESLDEVTKGEALELLASGWTADAILKELQ